MGIKNKLSYGIYPIASRRHQPRDSGYRYIHIWTPSEATVVLGAWLLTPIIAGLCVMFGHYDLVNVLFVVIAINIFITWAAKQD